MPEIMTLSELRARYPRTAIRAAKEIGPARHDAATTARIRILAERAQQATAAANPDTGETLDELVASTPDEEQGWR